MSKVIILAINAKYVHSSLSDWILSKAVSKYAQLPHDVKVIEATINQDIDFIAGQVIAYNPDVVGISSYIWNAGKLPELLNVLRENLPETVFVLGGPEASHNVEYWLRNGTDFVLRGEGERSFPAFLDMISENVGIESIPGLCYRKNGEMYIGAEPKPSEDLIDPYSENYFDALNGRIAYIETSRGCPFQCAFCLSGTSYIRFFPLDAIYEQIYKLSKCGTQTVKFVDRTFNCNTKRAYGLFEYVIGLETKCCFHFEVAADLFDERTLSLLGTAPPGRIQFEAGLQSFFEPALKASFRYTNQVYAEKNIRTLLEARNIHIHVDLIAGLPYETLPDFQNSFNRAYKLGAHTLQLGFLKLLHGSALREQPKCIVSAEEPPYEIISSPWLSAEDLKIIKHTENALQHTYNKGRFLSAIQYVLAVSKLSPFSFYRDLGEFAPNHGLPLSDYAEQIYDHCTKLPGIDSEHLLDCMIIDWLRMVKGENMPRFLRVKSERRKQAAKAAENLLGRGIARHESAVLHSGNGVFVDSSNRDPVTGLYLLYYADKLEL